MSSKDKRIITIMERWVKGEIKTDQADHELVVTGMKLPQRNPTKMFRIQDRGSVPKREE